MSSPESVTSSSPNSTPERRSPRAYVFAAIGAVAVVIVVGWPLYANSQYRSSFDATATLAERTSAAQLAARLEPWNATFSNRAYAMEKWQHGATYFAQGAYLPAMNELADAYKHDVGDKELLAIFKKAQVALNLYSNYKAHIQHAHEGPGGTLRPQDLLP